MEAVMTPITAKPNDFASDQEVRWCPGCGDYAAYAVVKKVLAKLNFDRSKTVFVSGIGCSSRFPYYMNTYGIHSIHGRAPTLASGLKIARPDLDVWIVTGDGDALAIGGNHFLHLIRRNLNIKVLLLNNRIYGLTKGQYSPTTPQGMKTKSSPMGALDRPLHPISVALGAESTFAARSIDGDIKHMEFVIERAAQHKGTAFVEIYQNCVIFNDGAYQFATDKLTKPQNVLQLEHGKPMIFGANREKGIRMRPGTLTPEVVNVKDVPADSLLIHDEHAADPALAFMLSRLGHPNFPEPMGIFRDVQEPTYDDQVHEQVQQAIAQKGGRGDLQKLLTGTESWRVS